MSGFELKKAALYTSEPDLAGQIVAKKEVRGYTPAELLSRRFASLNLLSDRGDVSFYEARDLRAQSEDRQVVLRVFKGPSDSSSLELFRLEALAAARLSHPNIIRSGALQEIHGVHFTILDYPHRCETLRNTLDRQGWLEPELAIEIVHRIAGALEYAHRLGVLHLKLHPDNVLIDADGTVLLSDFGVDARSELAWAHAERSSRCPAHYISPEQANGRPLDSRSDLYSLGVVFYQMLTDRFPIDSEDPLAIGRKHLTQSPLAPHLYCADIPPSLSAVIMCLLEKDPDARFRDTASFSAALDRYTNHCITRVSQTEDRVEEPRSCDDDGDECPIDLESLGSEPVLEPWERPLINAINQPAVESSEWEPNLDAVPEKNDQVEFSNHRQDLQEERQHAEALPGDDSRKLPSSSFQRRPVILVVMLLVAAISGLIVLANADRPKAPVRAAPPPPTTNTRNDEATDRSVTPQTNRREEVPGTVGTQSTSEPGATNRRTEPASAAPVSGRLQSGAATANRQRRGIRTSSTSQRLRNTRRRSLRPTLYFRQSHDPVRRYNQR